MEAGEGRSDERPLALVVDDDADVMRALVDCLADEYRVVTAAEGQQGLTLAVRLRPDVIITDIGMPGMRGDALVQAIRAHAELAATPVVILTGRSHERLRVPLLRQGAQDYVTKPFEIDELLARVDNLVAAKRAADERWRSAVEQQFLAEMGAVLSATDLDFDDTLAYTAGLVVGDLADACVVDTLADRERPPRSAVFHRDAAEEPLCRRLEQSRTPAAVRRVLESRQPLLLRDVTPAAAEDWESLRAFRARSAMVLPLVSHGVFGTVTLISSQEGRRYSSRDLGFAAEVAVRSALALDNARLYQQAVDEARQRELMMAVVSHDLKNDLASIPLSVDALLRSPAKATMHGERIKQTAERMLRLVRDLLDAAAIDDGRLSIEVQPIPARLFIDGAAGFEALAAEKSLELERQLAGADFEVRCDRGRIQQALANLVGNAIKFTERGTVSLRVEQKEGEALFSVADSGPGIGEDELPHVFDRYWQAAKTARLGTGLGLAITRGIVQAHGGRIWVESRPGAGSRFRFTLPLL
jgi:signal transduction histidine kinase/CheY-like chemotaxis protein